MYAVIGILGGIVLILAVILWKIQRQVKDICRQLTFLKEHDSNMMISRETGMGGMNELTDVLNDMLEVQKQERKKYQEKEKTISETYTNLSHDIRTPLTSLDGYFQLLEDSSDREEQKRYLSVIQERITSLKEMLEELFTFTKLKNGSYHMELQNCMVNRILKDEVLSYYEDWMERKINPSFEITEKPLVIEGNPQALKRIIQNIIKNGLDHGEKRIGITLREKGEDAVMIFKNEVEHPDKIDPGLVFDRFYKADESRSRSSTGLGLSIAKELVLRMNGEIRADIEGNLFLITVWFPEVK